VWRHALVELGRGGWGSAPARAIEQWYGLHDVLRLTARSLRCRGGSGIAGAGVSMHRIRGRRAVGSGDWPRGLTSSWRMSPTVFRDGPFRFFFFSREEERLHIHVQSPDGEANSGSSRASSSHAAISSALRI
jgi:hypothetical protein